MKLIFRYPDTGEIHEHNSKSVSVEGIFQSEAQFLVANLMPYSDRDDVVFIYQLVSTEGID